MKKKLYSCNVCRRRKNKRISSSPAQGNHSVPAPVCKGISPRSRRFYAGIHTQLSFNSLKIKTRRLSTVTGKQAPRFMFQTAYCSDVETEVHDVAVLHHVFLAFNTELAGLAHALFAVERYIVGILYYLGADEAFLEVGVDDTCALRSL